MAQKTNDEKGYLISAKGYYDLTLDLAREYRISQEKVIHDTEEYNQMELDQWDTYSMMN